MAWCLAVYSNTFQSTIPDNVQFLISTYAYSVLCHQANSLETFYVLHDSSMFRMPGHVAWYTRDCIGTCKQTTLDYNSVSSTSSLLRSFHCESMVNSNATFQPHQNMANIILLMKRDLSVNALESILLVSNVNVQQPNIFGPYVVGGVQKHTPLFYMHRDHPGEA